MDINKFNESTKRLFKTEDGEIVINGLKAMYVDTSAYVTGDDSSTFYRLGQKELIQGLIQEIETEKEHFNE